MRIKENLQKMKEKMNKLGVNMLYKENLELKNRLKGEFFITLNHKDGSEEKYYYKNIIVDSSSLLIARMLVDGQAAVDPVGPAHGLWVLAAGTGGIGWDKQNPPVPTTTQTQLVSELARKRFAQVYYVQTNGSGLPSSVPTNIIDLQTVFNESEAVGPLVEFGLFGGDADVAVANSGTLINYLTYQVINKPNNATMSIIFRLTC